MTDSYLLYDTDSDSKIDLLIHSSILPKITMCLNTELREYCNIITEHMLLQQSVKPFNDFVHVTDDRSAQLKRIMLHKNKPAFDEPSLVSRECGRLYTLADRTSYNCESASDDKHGLYSIERRRARYVLWPKELPLTVCATCVEFLPTIDCARFAHSLPMVLARAHEWAKNFFSSTSSSNTSFYKSIIVFDLDSTLIDPNDRIYDSCLRLLRVARELYDYVVLWSHGSTLHVHKQVDIIERYMYILSIEEEAEKGVNGRGRGDNDDDEYAATTAAVASLTAGYNSCSATATAAAAAATATSAATFCNLVLSYDGSTGNRCFKNLLLLYNYFSNCKFDVSVLVDDSPFNWTPEYSKFIVPNYKKTCQGVLNHI